MKQMTLFCQQLVKMMKLLERTRPDGEVFYQRINYNEVIGHIQ